MGKVIAISNRKGGVGKTTTTFNLGIALAKRNKKVLLVDLDSQASLTMSLGYKDPSVIVDDINSIIERAYDKKEIPPHFAELDCKETENVKLIPSTSKLARTETALVSALARERILKKYIDVVKDEYDYILIDCNPSLGLLTVNALTAANSVIIPTQIDPLSIAGLQLLIDTVHDVRDTLNPDLVIDGILFTMANERTNIAKGTIHAVKTQYADSIKVFDTVVPKQNTTIEASYVSESVFSYDPKGKVALAYDKLADEVIADE